MTPNPLKIVCFLPSAPLDDAIPNVTQPHDIPFLEVYLK